MTPNLVWEGATPSPEVVQATSDNIRRELGHVTNPANVITHLVILTDDMDGPCVHVFGKKGSDALHCRYHPEIEWVSFPMDGAP